MAKHLLLSALTALVVTTSLWAQAGDERAGFAIRGTSVKEAVSFRQNTNNTPVAVGEIYPNPTSNQGSVLINLNAAGKIVFYNLLGTPVATHEFTKETKLLTIDFSSFAEGVYFGIVSSGDKTIGTRRVSIKR
jgi:hypothetical protein